MNTVVLCKACLPKGRGHGETSVTLIQVSGRSPFLLINFGFKKSSFSSFSLWKLALQQCYQMENSEIWFCDFKISVFY